MNQTDQPWPQPGDPQVMQRRWPISPVWLLPIIAALIGILMLVDTWQSAGPDITISFQAASGLEAGKTAVKYKDVMVGMVKSITLSQDSTHVIVAVSLNKNAQNLARADTRFWVVRPRIGAGGVSGIDTLLSGAYIAVDTGASTRPNQEFAGLETPPTVVSGMPGTSFEIVTDDLGSLDIGSPVYYRRVPVGRVASYRLQSDGQGVSLQVFIDAPYDRFVTAGTRFWNAGGVDVSLGSDGFQLKTQTMAAILAGGIAFASPGYDAKTPPAATPYTYRLAKDEQTAMAPADGPAQYVQLRFEQSLRGMSVGAPVEFSSIKIGRVVSIELDYDASHYHFPSVVGIEVYPSRLGRVLEKLPKPEQDAQRQEAGFLRDMVNHGLRGQARTGNLLTGQLYVSLDFVPNAPPVPFDIHARPLRIPTINGGFDRLQEQLAAIIGKVGKMPLESIGRNLDATLADLDQTLKQVNTQVLPETTQTLRQARKTLGSAQDILADNAPLQKNLGQTMLEAQRTLRSVRELTDLLARHPQALLFGRPDDADPITQPDARPISPQKTATK